MFVTLTCPSYGRVRDNGTPADTDHMEHARRLLHAVPDRARWQAALAEARRNAAMHENSDVAANGRAA